jgi:hypothetical protein
MSGGRSNSIECGWEADWNGDLNIEQFGNERYTCPDSTNNKTGFALNVKRLLVPVQQEEKRFPDY